jgi:flagellar basal-body rod modification protein FlgD
MTSVTSTTTNTAPQLTAQQRLSGDLDMFLTLMTTQLKNQDPLDPIKSSEYTQQLATYSQVEQSIQQTSKLEAILSQLSSQSLNAAASYVGMNVTTSQSVAQLGPGGARWSYEVPASAVSTKLSVTDASGRVVLETNGATAKGTHEFAWTGGTTGGADAPDGPYTLKVVAVTSAGAEKELPATVTGEVTSAVMSNGALALMVGATEVPLSSLRSVQRPAG